MTDPRKADEMPFTQEANRKPPSRKRTRMEFDEARNSVFTTGLFFTFIRVKDLGTKLKQSQKRNQEIVNKAQRLPDGNRLSSRSVYWFVTREYVQIIVKDNGLFDYKEYAEVDVNGIHHYLYQIDFQKNKDGVVGFRFPNGATEVVTCFRTHTRPKLSHENDEGSPDQMHVDSATLSNNNNTNATNTNVNMDEDDEASADDAVIVDYDVTGNFEQHVQAKPPTHHYQGKQIINSLLLIPDDAHCIQMVESALKQYGFVKEVSSGTGQVLYTEEDMLTTVRYVLVLPYGAISRFRKVKDYLTSTSEVLLVVINQTEQTRSMLPIEQITDINNITGNSFKFTTAQSDYGYLHLPYSSLNTASQTILSITELQQMIIGGISCQKEIAFESLAEPFLDFLLKWNLGSEARPIAQSIYLCFRYEPKLVKPHSEYAKATLKALGIESGPVVANGSVLVYVRCPAYITWRILQREDVIDELKSKYDLTEIYECFLSDVEASMRRQDNGAFVHELTHIFEQMISDNIEEHPRANRIIVDPIAIASKSIGSVASTVVDLGAPEALYNKHVLMGEEFDEMSISAAEECPPTIDKLTLNKRTVLEQKHAELLKFDGKWNKTLEDCYNFDRLRQQLFNFKADKGAKFAVRVFISSTSAGMATNVAKLMRQFNGKSIVDGVHSGLQIANTIVEWNQSGLVHIGELKHTNATAVLFDVQDSVKFDFNDEIANKMINFIQRWNVEHQYSSTEYNSHRFVRDFLQETLNVSLVERFKGPLGSYMYYVMNTGDSTPRLISKNHGTIVFRTHQELEEVYYALYGQLSDEENKLLKIFHRGFQLQEAAHGKDVSSCIYGLPTNGLEILNDSGKPIKH